MSPLSTVLPPPRITFAREGVYPVRQRGTLLGGNLNTALFGRVRPGDLSTSSSISYDQPAGYGNLGADAVAAVVRGRWGALATTNGAQYARGWRHGWWMPAYDSAAFNPGAVLDDPSVCMTVDFNVACTSALFAPGTADQSGFWFMPGWSLPANLFAMSPAGGTARGGFGVALNDDGAGNNQWEWVTYDTLTAAPPYPGNVLSRVPLTVADVTDWQQFRFQIISAASGRDATVTLAVNGAAVAAVTDVVFDDVTLMRPGTLVSTATNFAWGPVLGDMGGEGFAYSLYFRCGRFTAAGVEVQPA